MGVALAAQRRFVYDAQPVRVRFGTPLRDALPAELERLGVRRALVLCSPARREQVADALAACGERIAGTCENAAMHVPLETAVAARALAERLDADAYLAIGGGSPIGLAKAIALVTGRPIVAVPTTYSGSEMTPIYGITENRAKRTGRDRRVLPATAIYDPAQTLTMPPELTVTSAFNAIAHAVEALYSADANPIASLMAQESIGAFGRALPALVRDPSDAGGRSDALYGAWLAGAVLGGVGMALHHKIAHVLGGTYGLPHAPAHTVVLPHAAAYNEAAAPAAMAAIAGALGSTARAPAALFDFARATGAPLALRALGMREADLDAAADRIAAEPYPNPRPVERTAIRALLQDAFDGRRPGD